MKSPDFDFVISWCRKHNVRRYVMMWIEFIYQQGYDQKSDGMTGVSELTFSHFDDEKPHPAAVAHDYLYLTGALSRCKADLLFRHALEDMGHPYRAKIRWLGVRMFGWYYWNKMKGNHEKHRIGKNRIRPH